MKGGTGNDFWSRRKARVEAEEHAERTAVELAEAEHAELALAEKTDEELLAELDLPDPDTLENGEQVREFLQAALPQRLKNRALRRLWLTNPVLANVDGLVDYGEDFTDAAMVVPNMQTVYKVGRGMIDWLEEKAAEEERDAAAAEALALEAEGEAAEDLAEPEPEELRADIVQAEPYSSPVSDDTDPDPLPAPSRRMQFSFTAVS